MERSRLSYEWLYQLCVLYIGIPTRGGDYIPVEPGIPRQPGIQRQLIPLDNSDQIDQLNPILPIPIRDPYYPNSIEEYRYSLYLSNIRGSRTGLDKKKKSAESGIKFLQYSKSQREFMGFLLRLDEITYKRVIEYSNPSILKAPFRSKVAFPDNSIPADQSSK